MRTLLYQSMYFYKSLLSAIRMPAAGAGFCDAKLEPLGAAVVPPRPVYGPGAALLGRPSPSKASRLTS